MEKYSQFRDRGTAIAPFLPVPTPPAGLIWSPIHALLFLIRIPPLLCFSIFYFFILQWLPVGSWVKKCALWVVLGIPGVWWVDLQVDGVKRGRLALSKHHLPGPGTVIAASFTSPLDPLYLAAIFRPIFTRSYPGIREVEQISLFSAILMAFSHPTLTPSDSANLTTLAELEKKYPDSIIAVFPECTTTNGRGILPCSPCLLSTGPKTRIYPVNLRYTPADITTPVPGGYFSWLWKLCSKPTHSMRVRIAESVYNTAPTTAGDTVGESSGFDTNIVDSSNLKGGNAEDYEWSEEGAQLAKVNKAERKVLDRVGEDLARLGRVKRVGLRVKEKIEFVKVWAKRRR